MRHNRDEKRFDRSNGHLRCMLANMTNDLVLAGRIKTTTPRAKVLRRYAEKMVTLGKDGSTAARRRAFAFMRSKDAVKKLFDDLAPKYVGRNGGYTRILKLGVRPGDNAAMSLIEFVEGGAIATETKPKAAKKTRTAKPKEASAAKPKAAAKPKEKAPAKPRAAKTAKAEEKATA